jgi:hypothetical protein
MPTKANFNKLAKWYIKHGHNYNIKMTPKFDWWIYLTSHICLSIAMLTQLYVQCIGRWYVFGTYSIMWPWCNGSGH